MKIAIDAGHGLNTPGKRCMRAIDPKETREWFLNARIARKIEKLLAEFENVETMRVDDVTGQTDIAMDTRCKNSNKWGADWYISCHHNAGIGGGSGGGLVVYSYINPTAKIQAMRKAIYDEVISLTGLKGNRSQPLNSAEFYVLKYTNAPAILIEYGYMDSTVDTPIILTEDFANKAAQGTVIALAKQLNLKKKIIKPIQEDVLDMTKEELNALIDSKINASKEREYNYWNQLPDWAHDKIKKLYDNGLFSGKAADNLGLPESMMRTLVIMCNALIKAGVIK